ncbi:MAG: 1-phosphofructokinase [Hespellia sp.]|nr:1-phosphofructokinase [Hespellia sp.]
MIITVTMNPAIDKTIDVDQLQKGELNRIKSVEKDVGGKGINVSKTINELGGKSTAIGFIAGDAGKTIEHVLNREGIQTDFIEVEGETRTNTKVVEANRELTELNEQGPELTKEDVEKLLEKIEGYANEDVLFVLAGSIPKGVEKDIYERIIRLVHGKGAKVILDADGELFTKALQAGPDIIKPNRFELEQYAGFDYRASEKEVLGVAKQMLEKGVSTVAVSMGKSGAMFLIDGEKYRCAGLNVKAHSTVGAGDAMVAALAYSWDQKYTAEKTIAMCMAVSAGAVMTIGTKPPKKEMVEELLKQVEIETLK